MPQLLQPASVAKGAGSALPVSPQDRPHGAPRKMVGNQPRPQPVLMATKTANTSNFFISFPLCKVSTIGRIGLCLENSTTQELMCKRNMMRICHITVFSMWRARSFEVFTPQRVRRNRRSRYNHRNTPRSVPRLRSRFSLPVEADGPYHHQDLPAAMLNDQRPTRSGQSPTSLESASTDVRPSRVAWSVDGWCTERDLSLGLDDWGVLQGAVAVDRLRTVGGRVLDLPLHLERFRRSCQALQIELPTRIDFAATLETLVERNLSSFQGQDLAVVMLATPGRNSDQESRATCMMHTAELPWARLAQWYAHGQRLEISEHRNVPAVCWAPAIKTRARLQYFLADQELTRATHSSEHGVATESGGAHPGAMLLDTDGYLTETSVANFVIVEGDRVVSPVEAKILPGISLQRTLRLAAELKMEIKFEDIDLERACRCDELLLCGTSGCLWAANRIAERRFENCTEGRVFSMLSQAWQRELQFDYVRQAVHGGGQNASDTAKGP